MLFNLKVITFIAVTVAVFILAAQTPDFQGKSDGIGLAIPLTKRSTTDARESHATSDNGKIIRGPNGMDGSERNMGMPHPFAVQRDGSAAGLDLTKYVNGIWYGTILIGTPPRSFTVQLNTGFSDLFVPASVGDENCRSHPNLWDPASSLEITNLNLNIDFAIEFEDGRTASGKQYMDNVTIAGFTADNQIIGAATTYSSTLGSVFAPDGILGLGFPPLTQLYGHSPLLHTLFNEGKLSQPVFSLMLTASGGELYIGGMNTALYYRSTLAYTPVLHPVLWQLYIDNIQVNGHIVLTNVLAVIDTAANLIYGDPRQVLALHQAAAGGESPFGGGFFTFPCMSFPSVTFTIGRRPFSMSANVLNKGRIMPKSPKCFSGIAVANEDHRLWSIGTIFLEQFYTVFDFDSRLPRVGFAQLTGAV